MPHEEREDGPRDIEGKAEYKSNHAVLERPKYFEQIEAFSKVERPLKKLP
jgi:hypothetical protein